MLGILGNKVGMTQIFSEDGDANPVTIIKVGPCVITQIKSIETDGYNSVQLGYQEVKKEKLTKPELGHLAKSTATSLKYLKEYRIDNVTDFELGQVLDVQNFEEGQFVDISGRSIGKGFTGNQKRHNFTRGPMTHGSKNHRAPGSIGQGSTPGRVYPGKKMAGRLGGKQTTVSNLEILKVDTKQNLLIVKGSVPGKPGNLLSIKPTIKV
uniref:ribosomal protein L3 n=1 Tax=Meringosphaera mediterranea TaxID=2837474 RepID=UPI00286A92A2|nr:ribosomal protein L3 [Meringosphaera mediterranea]WLD05732.1 ribosomal protein L3 [Meringosphaera mediterranea]WLD05858.1 ribosomal protein L3 [Meringosphaera mediterranea]WLD06078.1 ribosomal protein L3 [Meringosphaera mediterranea]